MIETCLKNLDTFLQTYFKFPAVKKNCAKTVFYFFWCFLFQANDTL